MVAIAIGCLCLGWYLGRKSLMEGFRMGRISQGQPDILLADKGAKREIVRLGDEYDPYAEAMKEPANHISTVEGEKQ